MQDPCARARGYAVERSSRSDLQRDVLVSTYITSTDSGTPAVLQASREGPLHQTLQGGAPIVSRAMHPWLAPTTGPVLLQSASSTASLNLACIG